ncbi:MAG: acetyl-CoA C-acetyltransferase [Candidatus Korobacteraceae bacterium]|jgi:acetyl-CoA acetyltransferase family protein
MSNTFPEIAIVNGARTPMGRYCGKLRDFSAQELAAIASVEAMKRAGVVPVAVNHCIMGNAQQTSSDAIYGARHVALKAGIPIDVPALTVNRLCGSGMQSVVSAAQMIQLGEAKCVLAGGMESMSQAPHVIRGMRWGVGFGEGKLEDSLFVALTDSYCNMPMAVTAEAYAGQQGVTREMQDEYALCSQQRAEAAYQAGKIQEELTPVALLNKHGEPSGKMFTEDDHRRPETTLESLAKLKPSFGKNGTVTAGNASGIVDGAAAVIVMSLEAAHKRELNPLARIVSWGIAGVEPSLMGSGPVPATRIALKKAGLTLSDIDLIELNEAFAAQCLAVMRELELDPAKTNVNGGAIALGHPLGATGTRLLITLAYELRRRKARYGLSTACIGGGQGIAVIIENLQR